MMRGTDEFAIPSTILKHFDLSSSPYTEQFSNNANERRKVYPDGKLFIDQLLNFAQVDGPTLYPPTSPANIRRLIYSISVSPLDRLKQDCYLYYLLKDYDAAEATKTNLNGQDEHGMDVEGEAGPSTSSLVGINGRVDEARSPEKESSVGRASKFARRRCIPKPWRVFIDGYWAMDNEKWDVAVKCLSDTSISDLNFISDILLVLATQVSPPSRSLSLINKFLSVTKPPLDTRRDNLIQLLATASGSSTMSAFSVIRDNPNSEERTTMRGALWSWSLGASPVPCGKGQTGIQPRALQELLHQPLNAEEHAHMVYFVSHPPKSISPQALSAFQDLVTLRLIHQGQYAESLQLDKESAGSTGADTDRQGRREMVREFISILPAVQRKALAVEGDIKAQRDETEHTGLVNGFQGEIAAGDDEMEEMQVDKPRSWLDVQAAMPVDETTNLPSKEIRRVKSNISMAVSQSGTPSAAANTGSLTPRRPHSPFTGPPRFASNPVSLKGSPQLAPLQRVLSGSPFALPKSAVVSRGGSPAASVRPLRPIINDDHDPLVLPIDRQRTASMASRGSPLPSSRPTLPLDQVEEQYNRIPQSILDGQGEAQGSGDVVEPDNEDEIPETEQPERELSPEPLQRSRRSKPSPRSESKSRRTPSTRPSRRRQTPLSQPPPEAEEVAQHETTPPPPSPPPSPPSHHTRSHDTPASPQTNSQDLPNSTARHTRSHDPPASAPRPTRKTRTNSSRRLSMPGAFEPKENEPTIPEDSVLPPTPAPQQRRAKQTAATEPRSRMTRSASRALLEEDDTAANPPKRTRRNVREGSALSTTSVGETPAGMTRSKSFKGKGRARQGTTVSPTPSQSTVGVARRTSRKRTTGREGSVSEDAPATTRRSTRRR